MPEEKLDLLAVGILTLLPPLAGPEKAVGAWELAKKLPFCCRFAMLLFTPLVTVGFRVEFRPVLPSSPCAFTFEN